MRALQASRLLIVLSLCLMAPPIAAAGDITLLALTDSATFTPGLPDVGSLGTIFCTGLTGVNGVQAATQYPLPYQIAGVSVSLFGIRVPLLAVADFGSYQQINFQVWEGLDNNPIVEVAQQGLADGRFAIPVPSAWGVFFTDPKGYAVAQHADYSLVTLDHPVRPGEVLVAYATNLEQFAYVLNYPSVGYPAQANPLPSIAPSSPLRSAPYVTLNSVVAEMFYSGLTPGSVGVFQVNFRVPNATPDGDAILNAVTDTVCINQGLPSGYCIDGKKSLGAKIPVKAAPAP